MIDMNFIEEDISSIIPDELKTDLENNEDLVKANLSYLKSLGIENYQDIFKTYYPIFLMDNSNFQEIFSKYDVSDLIDKINKNIAIIEHL